MASMKLIIVAFVIVLAACRETTKKKLNKPIVSGKPASVERIPFQAQILYRKKVSYCGATIIDSCWLLTTAHCVHGRLIKAIAGIIVGSNYTAKGFIRSINQIILHPDFDGEETYKYDIALIELKNCIQWKNGTRAVKLSNIEPKAGSVVQISGFGKTKENDTRLSPHLNLASVKVVDRETCRLKYSKLNRKIDDSVFCASTDEADSCDGDSGGPAFVNNELVGIISCGESCGDTYYPSTYTRIDMFINWIRNETKLNDLGN